MNTIKIIDISGINWTIINHDGKFYIANFYEGIIRIPMWTKNNRRPSCWAFRGYHNINDIYKLSYGFSNCSNAIRGLKNFLKNF